MINDYRDYILRNKGNIFIFAPNSWGKTIFAETFLKISSSNKKYHLINKNNFNSILDGEKKTQKLIINSGEDWDLKIGRPENEAFLYKNDILFINAFISSRVSNMRIEKSNENRSLLKNLIIKKGQKKFTMSNASRLKEQLSASEFELFMMMIFISSIFNSKKKIILDDPIEVSSWENERMFISFLEYLFKKEISSSIILLTHRISLYKKLIGLHKKAKINLVRSCYLYFIDGFPFLIEDYDSNCLDLPSKETLKENEVFKRMYLEDIYSRLFFSEIGKNKQTNNVNDVESKNVYGCKKLEVVKEYNELTKNIKNASYEEILSYDKTKIQTTNLFDYISFKFIFINILRNSIISDWNKHSQTKIKSLGEIARNIDKHPDFFKKAKSCDQIIHLHKTLNDFSHKSEWLLWNEINITNIIRVIEKNYSFRVFQNTFSTVKAIKESLKTIKSKWIAK